jgi:hypothetical protein
MLFTGKGIDVYRLTVAKHAVKLEALGIRMSRGRKWTPLMRKEFGLKRSATPEQVIAAIDAKLAEVVPVAQAEGGIRP